MKRRALGNRLRPPDTNDVADPVDLDFETSFSDPCNELVPSKLFAVGSGEAHKPAISIASNLTQSAKTAKESLGDYGKAGHCRACSLPQTR
jgi:hypothetical protein